MGDEVPKELQELVGFLNAGRADVRAQAAELVAGLTGTHDAPLQPAGSTRSSAWDLC